MCDSCRGRERNLSEPPTPHADITSAEPGAAGLLSTRMSRAQLLRGAGGILERVMHFEGGDA